MLLLSIIRTASRCYADNPIPLQNKIFSGAPPEALRTMDNFVALIRDGLTHESGASVDVPHGTTVTCRSAETPGEAFNVAIEMVCGSGWAAVQYGVSFKVPLTERSNAETKFGECRAVSAQAGGTLVEPIPTQTNSCSQYSHPNKETSHLLAY